MWNFNDDDVTNFIGLGGISSVPISDRGGHFEIVFADDTMMFYLFRNDNLLTKCDTLSGICSELALFLKLEDWGGFQNDKS